MISNSTNINKTNNQSPHILTELFENKQKERGHDVVNSGSGLEQAHAYSGVKRVKWAPL